MMKGISRAINVGCHSNKVRLFTVTWKSTTNQIGKGHLGEETRVEWNKPPKEKVDSLTFCTASNVVKIHFLATNVETDLQLQENFQGTTKLNTGSKQGWKYSSVTIARNLSHKQETLYNTIGFTLEKNHLRVSSVTRDSETRGTLRDITEVTLTMKDRSSAKYVKPILPNLEVWLTTKYSTFKRNHFPATNVKNPSPAHLTLNRTKELTSTKCKCWSVPSVTNHSKMLIF